jgi:hypothetical protein
MPHVNSTPRGRRRCTPRASDGHSLDIPMLDHTFHSRSRRRVVAWNLHRSENPSTDDPWKDDTNIKEKEDHASRN